MDISWLGNAVARLCDTICAASVTQMDRETSSHSVRSRVRVPSGVL